MNTTCPIATISYNSKEFLVARLQELQRNHSISSWFFIFHYAEGQRPKDHFHVWLKPNKRLDTMTLQEFFEEDDPGNPDGPKLGCIDFVSSKIDFAILYFAHYKPYLTYIHQKRIYHYDWDQFVVSDQNWFDDALYKALHFSKFAEDNRMLSAINDNEHSLSELITTGIVPLNLASQVFAYSNLLDQDRVVRGKKRHKPTAYGSDGFQVTQDGIVGGGGVIINK